jgi:dihydroflavonol-4-reductase
MVTGGTGHLGNTLVSALVSSGKRVRALVLPNDPLMGVVDKRAEIVYGDVSDKQSLGPFFANPDGANLIVIHTAGIVSIASKFDSRLDAVNVGGTRNVVQLCEEHNVRRLVYVSSVHAIEEAPHGNIIEEAASFDPARVIGHYAKTKAEATALVLEAYERGLDLCVVHPSGIIGPYDFGNAHMTQLLIDYAKGHLWACVDGGYDFVDVRDVVNGILLCIERGGRGECYILSNVYIRVCDLLSELRKITGGKRVWLVFPRWFIRLVSPLAEWYYTKRKQKPLFSTYSMYTLGSNSIFSNSKARTELGFAPRPLKETLKDSIDWLRGQGRI